MNINKLLAITVLQCHTGIVLCFVSRTSRMVGARRWNVFLDSNTRNTGLFSSFSYCSKTRREDHRRIDIHTRYKIFELYADFFCISVEREL